jgi:cytochrome c553
MKKIYLYITAILISFTITFCTTSTEPTNTSDISNTPSDHTVNEHGVMHKSGLHDPGTNCISCHGADLQGGEVGVSCYNCHGKKW